MHNQRNIDHNSINKYSKERERPVPYILLDSKNEAQKNMKKDFVIEVEILLQRSGSQFNKYFDYVRMTFERNGIKVLKSKAGKGFLRIYP